MLTMGRHPPFSEGMTVIDVDQYVTVLQARACLLSSAEKRIASGVRDVIMEINSGQTLDRNVEEVMSGLIDGSISTGVVF
jgi:hypothetical protein